MSGRADPPKLSPMAEQWERIECKKINKRNEKAQGLHAKLGFFYRSPAKNTLHLFASKLHALHSTHEIPG